MNLTGDHCQCPSRGLYFNSTRAFDMHRFGDWYMRRCRTPDSMLEIGMAQNVACWWVTKLHDSSSRARRIAGDRSKVVRK